MEPPNLRFGVSGNFYAKGRSGGEGLEGNVLWATGAVGAGNK